MTERADHPEGVDLETFVSESLLGVLRGIRKAQADSELGPLVNPKHAGTLSGSLSYGTGGTRVATVDFDVAVTATSASASSGKAGAKVWVLEAGGDIRKEVSNQRVSRIRFAAIVELPGPQRDRLPKRRPSVGHVV